jgi:hypothetical protein
MDPYKTKKAPAGARHFTKLVFYPCLTSQAPLALLFKITKLTSSSQIMIYNPHLVRFTLKEAREAME